MDVQAETQRAREPERTIQFSVFLENKVGRLLDLTRMLETAGIQIVAVSVLDTSDCGIERILVSDPDRTRQILHEHAHAFTETPVIVAEMTEAAELRGLLAALFQGECNILFMYPLLTRPRGRPCLVLNVEDRDCARTVLRAAGYEILTQHDISR